MAHPPPAFFTGSFSFDEVPSTHDPAPTYRAERYGDIWEHWAAVNRANQRVTEIQVKLADLEPELQTKTKEYERLKETSSALFVALHGKSRSIVPNALRRISSGSSAKSKALRDTAREDFELAHREETTTMMKLETLRETVDGLKTQLQTNTALAGEADQVFELLGASMARSISTAPEHVTASERRLAELSSAHEQGQKLVTDLVRARVTVQHAHHYYTDALQTMDAVRGTALGRAAFGGLGEMSKNKDYQAAVTIASKAQICFNETVRVLTPHTAIIPVEAMADFTKLKEMGLLQASKIYGLMYGWKHATSGVGKSVKLMLEKQEVVFACLTRFAVWVQNEVPIAEVELRAARISRDEARRELAAAWKAQNDCANPPSP